MVDEFTSNPVIRKMENYEIHERMNYSFEKTPWGWAWKRSENAMTVEGHKNIITILDLYLRSSEDERKKAIDIVYNNDTFENLLNDYETKKAQITKT